MPFFYSLFFLPFRILMVFSQISSKTSQSFNWKSKAYNHRIQLQHSIIMRCVQHQSGYKMTAQNNAFQGSSKNHDFPTAIIKSSFQNLIQHKCSFQTTASRNSIHQLLQPFKTNERVKPSSKHSHPAPL